MQSRKAIFPTTIFVFGSNTLGRHGAGAALDAVKYHGAKEGIAEGLMGNSYALPTVKGEIINNRTKLSILSLEDIQQYILTFINFAKNNPLLSFQLTEVGCGLAGYKKEDIIPLFPEFPQNVFLSYTWQKHLNPTMKNHLIIAGGRNFTNYELLKMKVDTLLGVKKDDFVIISGGAKGADTYGERYAKENNLPVIVMPAEWNRNGFLDRRAGFIRNEKMAWYASHLIAFWDGQSTGTKSMIDLCEKYKLEKRIISY
jgi:hypothetical protein